MCTNKGGGGGKSSGGGALSTYDRIPIVFRLGGSSYATKEEKAQRREILTKFMNEAKIGNVYITGNGLGSSGSEFKIVSSRGKMALKWTNSNRPVQLDRKNAESFIANGARLIRKEKSQY